MSDHPGAPEGSTALSGPSGCRIQEFSRWNRTMLEHEREHLSQAMSFRRAFMTPADVDNIMHDLKDIDYVLTFHEKRVET